MGYEHMEWDTYVHKITIKTLYVIMVPHTNLNIFGEEKFNLGTKLNLRNILYHSNDETII